MPFLGSYVVPHPPLIIPEVGRGKEKDVKLTIDSYETISKEISDLEPDTIIISSPHAKWFQDRFWISNAKTISGNLSNFGAENVNFKEEIDNELAEEIELNATNNNISTLCTDSFCELDHASIVPLYFLRKYYKKAKIIIIGLSSLPLIKHYHFGMIIKKSIENLNRKVVFIASGDLSHRLQSYGPYGYNEKGKEYEERIIKSLSNGDFYDLLNFKSSLLEEAGECGHRSFTIMSGLYDGMNLEKKFYSHEDITGVGYGIISFKPTNEDKNHLYYDKYLEKEKNHNPKSIYTSLAYQSIKYYLENKEYMSIPDNIPEELINNRRGVFVSIHKFDELRGCIGTTSAVYSSIAEEIIYNAVAAGEFDPRFEPINIDEYPYLDISVDNLF